ncbi:MAG: hypothetical protein N2484_01830 [Clostridia bacterium]|nr:hypothetical protein [Clostridia bacterium]
MNRRRLLIAASIIIIALLGAAYVTLSQPKANSKNEESAAKKVETAVVDSGKKTEEKNPDLTEPAVSEKKEENIKSEEIAVANNTPEYDMKAFLCQLNSGEVFMKLEYYVNGESLTRQVNAETVPQLKDVFSKREKNTSNPQAFGIQSVYLNPKLHKAYFIASDKPIMESAEITLYGMDLKEGSVNKLFSQIGKFSDFKFSKDMKYLAFSYVESALSSQYPRRTLLQVLECSKDKFAVNGNKDAKGNLIGNNTDQKMVYHYSLMSWQSNNTLKIKETVFPKNSDTGEKSRELLYDIEKNLLTNMDGSPAIAGQTAGNKDGQAAKADSEPVKALKGFYTNLSSGQYTKAYDLLDDKFQLNAFKLMGVAELSKKDIDVESFSAYGSFFKTAKIESVVHDKMSGNTANVYFYQVFSISEGNEVKQALVATLKKTAKGWKIAAVGDGNINEKPFKQ